MVGWVDGGTGFHLDMVWGTDLLAFEVVGKTACQDQPLLPRFGLCRVGWLLLVRKRLLHITQVINS